MCFSLYLNVLKSIPLVKKCDVHDKSHKPNSVMLDGFFQILSPEG